MNILYLNILNEYTRQFIFLTNYRGKIYGKVSSVAVLGAVDNLATSTRDMARRYCGCDSVVLHTLFCTLDPHW